MDASPPNGTTSGDEELETTKMSNEEIVKISKECVEDMEKRITGVKIVVQYEGISQDEKPKDKPSKKEQALKSIERKMNMMSAVNPYSLWPRGEIPYKINSKLENYAKFIEAAMKEIKEETGCVEFFPRQNERIYLDITISEKTGQDKRCSSDIGIKGRKQKLKLDPQHLNRITYLHELCHAIGLDHEHQRWIRANYLHINYNNIREDKLKQFAVLKTEDIHGEEFDFHSIMLYGPYDFAQNPQQPVMTPITSSTKLNNMEEKLGLSQGDIQKIRRLYNC